MIEERPRWSPQRCHPFLVYRSWMRPESYVIAPVVSKSTAGRPEGNIGMPDPSNVGITDTVHSSMTSDSEAMS